MNTDEIGWWWQSEEENKSAKTLFLIFIFFYHSFSKKGKFHNMFFIRRYTFKYNVCVTGASIKHKCSIRGNE